MVSHSRERGWLVTGEAAAVTTAAGLGDGVCVCHVAAGRAGWRRRVMAGPGWVAVWPWWSMSGGGWPGLGTYSCGDAIVQRTWDTALVELATTV